MFVFHATLILSVALQSLINDKKGRNDYRYDLFILYQ